MANLTAAERVALARRFLDAEVPARDAAYRAVVSTARARDAFDVSTAVTAEWTFRSKFVDEETAGLRQACIDAVVAAHQAELRG